LAIEAGRLVNFKPFDGHRPGNFEASSGGQMAGRAEFLYAEIKDRQAIDALIDEPEDGHLDCKEWPNKEKEGHEMFAKAVCGLTNSAGGVLVIGMRAKSQGAGEPDVITEIAPVPDTSQLRSRLLTLAGQLVEPPIVGIETREIAEADGSKSGFVIVFVPRSEGPPHRSRKDSRFYIRVGSVTLPMEYWQIEDRFGSRPHPKLELILDAHQPFYNTHERGALRRFVLGLVNSGLGIAKFPAVQFKIALGLSLAIGIDGRSPGIRQRPSESEWIIFGGGVDDVIYPGQRLMITKLIQYGENKGLQGTILTPGARRTTQTRFVFREIRFTCEISCEGCRTETAEKIVPETDLVVDRDI
jgi:hypothetical protein